MQRQYNVHDVIMCICDDCANYSVRKCVVNYINATVFLETNYQVLIVTGLFRFTKLQ